jgi:hypothetical protein
MFLAWTPAVSHEVDFTIAGRRLVPVRKRADGNLLTGLGRHLPFLARRRGTAHGSQEPVDGRGTGREQVLSNGRVQGQMTMLFQGGEQTGQDRLETLATNPIGSFPHDNQSLAYCLTIDMAIYSRGLG